MFSRWKSFGRWIAFIPAGLLAAVVVRLISLLIYNFLSWRNPPEEFGNSFVEGGLIYFLFGSPGGRRVIFFLWSILTEAAAIFIFMRVAVGVSPSNRASVFSILSVIVILIYLICTFTYLISPEYNSDYLIFECIGGLFGAFICRWVNRRDRLNEIFPA